MNEVINGGWSKLKLGDHLSEFPKSKKPSRISDKNGLFNFYICSQIISKSSKFDMNEESILLSTGGEASIHFATGKYSYSTDVWAIKTSGDLLNSYAYRCLEFRITQINYYGFQGSSIRHLDKEFVKNLVFLIPPLPEQKKIVSILNSVDDVIEKTQSQIDNLHNLKKGTINKLLIKGIGHTEFKDSELGRIPKSWNESKLINLSKSGISNGVFNDPKNVGHGYKLVNVYDMYQGFGLDVNSLKKLSINKLEFKQNQVFYGDIFFTRSSLKLEGIAHCNICLSDNTDITYDGHLMKISPNTNIIEPIFLAIYCLSNFSRSFLMKMSKHSTMTTIGQKDIAFLPVPIPSLEEQQKIISIFMSFENLIKQKEKKFLKLNHLKKSLMQDLLTGKVRVSVN